MKRTILAVILVTVLGFGAFADNVRLGLIGAVEFDSKPDYDTVVSEFHTGDNVLKGFYWEVIPDHIGYGMTCNFLFDRQESIVPEVDYQWYMDWIATWDFRYHPLRWSFVDPFVEFGMGCAGQVDITDYEEYGLEEDTAGDPLFLSLFAQVGWGLGFRLGAFDLGARMAYRFWNEPPPATQFEPYPLEEFNIGVFGGFHF
ncbi:MAG: hypothetical protein JSV89_08505 [Spirochaetaceae bacterium]|nr:MAG: hypothetical protein JSV89_08505 [Spirochaetaceae bacterium]